jgi:hypothetical protein
MDEENAEEAPTRKVPCVKFDFKMANIVRCYVPGILMCDGLNQALPRFINVVPDGFTR